MKKMSMISRLGAALLALVLALPVFAPAPAAAAGEAKELYYWKLDTTSTENTMETLKDNLRQGSARSNVIWQWSLKNNNVVTAGGKKVNGSYFLRTTTGGKNYGLPIAEAANGKLRGTESLDLQFTQMTPIATRGLAALNLSITYLLQPSSFDTPVFQLDKLKLSVSTDGEHWLDGSVGIRSWKLLGTDVAKPPNTSERELYIYDIETENILDIPGLKPGDRILSARLQPYGDFYYTFGYFIVFDMTFNGFETMADFEAAVPAMKEPVLNIGEDKMRDIVVEHGRMIGETEWTSDSIIYADYVSSTAGRSSMRTYAAGIPWHGPAYMRNNKPDYEVWRETSIQDGKWIGGSSTESNMGMDCMVFGFDCISRVSRSHSWVIWQTQSDNSLQLMGNLKAEKAATFTNTDIVPLNTEQEMYEAYALMRKGDVMTTYTTVGGIHIRIAARDAEVVRKADGTIDGAKSTVYVVEQGSSHYYYYKDASGKVDRVNYASNDKAMEWFSSHPQYTFLYASDTRLDYPHSFKDMFDTFYVPLTLKEYATGTVRDASVQMRLLPKNGDIRNGMRIETSADWHITQLDVKLEDRDTGKVLFNDRQITNGHEGGGKPHQRFYTWTYDKPALDAALAGLTDGDYRVTVGLMCGPVTEARATRPWHNETYDFTVSDRAPANKASLNMPSSLNKGQSVDVTVNLAAKADAADVEIKYDADKLTYVTGTCSAGVNSVTEKNGLVRITAAGASISGRLGSVSFTAKQDVPALADAIEIKSAMVATAQDAIGGAAKATGAGDGYASIGFADVTKNAWYRPAVDYVYENNIMSGYSADTFGPNNTLTRAMVVQVLYNKEQKPAVEAANPFKDIASGQWYFNAVRWGAAKNVVAGFGGGVFKPDDNVTVEQVAVILHNYSGKPAGSGDVTGLGAHSGWAEPALSWAVEKGIFAGMPDFSVTGPATRAQTAQMLTNYLK